jgi:hypothetical protein
MTQKPETDNLTQLEKLLEIHPNVLIQKWTGTTGFPYEIKLGSGNKWGRGNTLSEALDEALAKDPKTIKGVPGEIR